MKDIFFGRHLVSVLPGNLIELGQAMQWSNKLCAASFVYHDVIRRKIRCAGEMP
jgi:hypothetical protein